MTSAPITSPPTSSGTLRGASSVASLPRTIEHSATPRISSARSTSAGSSCSSSRWDRATSVNPCRRRRRSALRGESAMLTIVAANAEFLRPRTDRPPGARRTAVPSRSLATRREAPETGRSARAAVVHHLDVVAVRVEHVRAVVAGVVVRTFAGAAAVAVAGRGCRPVEGVDAGVVGGRERHVDVLRRPSLPQREGAPRPDELDMVRSRPAELEPRVRREALVEAARRGNVRHAEPEVVDPTAAHRAVMDGLDAVSVGVEQERAVVVAPILRSRAGPAVVLAAGVGARKPERVDVLA